jgi:hypothetical protein
MYSVNIGYLTSPPPQNGKTLTNPQETLNPYFSAIFLSRPKMRQFLAHFWEAYLIPHHRLVDHNYLPLHQSIDMDKEITLIQLIHRMWIGLFCD